MNQFLGWLLSLINVDPEIVRQVDQAELLWTRPEWLYLGLALLLPPFHQMVNRLTVCRTGVGAH